MINDDIADVFFSQRVKRSKRRELRVELPPRVEIFIREVSGISIQQRDFVIRTRFPGDIGKQTAPASLSAFCMSQ